MQSRQQKNSHLDIDHVLRETRTLFITGLLLLLPSIATIWVLTFLFNILDGLTGSVIYALIGQRIRGLGFITTFLFVILVGLLTKNIVGKNALKVLEGYVAKIPIIGSIYSSSKQIVEAVTMQNKSAFKKVVLVEYPRTGMYAIGFVTNEEDHELYKQNTDTNAGKGLLSVFVPTTPNPTTGYVILLPVQEVTFLDISIDEAMKIVISAGLLNVKSTRKKEIA